MTPPNIPLDEQEGEEVQYDLAGNPLPPKPKAALPPVAVPVPGGFLAAPGFAPPPAYAPPPGFTPLGVVPAARPAPSGLALYGGLAAATLVLVGLIFIVRALRPVTVSAPTAYKTYAAIDNTFSCDQPVGWTMHETGATSGAESTVTFEKAHVRVRIISDSTGSLMGDIVGAGSNAGTESLPGMPPPPPPKPAVEKLHEMDEAHLAADLPGYKESDMQKLSSRVGDARLSEWTADGGKMHGYRVTMLGNQREMTVICLAPERNWAVLQPAFQRMIMSVVPGSG